MQRQNRLLNLIRDNMDAPRSFEVRQDAADEATIYLYDAIDPWWGIAAQDFIKALAAITAPTIHLRINSPGGDVFEARAIATAIRQHKSSIIAHIDGLAASAATYVAISAKEVEMSDGAFFMIHQAWAVAFGNAGDMLQMADLLDKVDASIVADYQKKTRKEAKQLTDWMAAETWFTAQEAKDAGFVDRVAGAAAAENKWNLGAYRNAPKALTEPEARTEPKAPDRDAIERRLALYQRIAA